MPQGAARRVGRGRPTIRPKTLVGDRVYSYDRIRQWLWRRGIKIVIPRRRNRTPGLEVGKKTYRERNRVERWVGQLERHRRIAMRDEKRAVHFLALLTIARIRLWL